MDQQVEDFIKEFFDEEEKEEEPLEKKDFLAEFFQELEDEEKEEKQAADSKGKNVTNKNYIWSC